MFDLESVISALLPTSLDALGVGKLILLLVITVFLIGLIGRLLFKKHSTFSKALATTLSVVIVYAVTAALISSQHYYCILPANIPVISYLPDLPFISLSGSMISVQLISALDFPTLCTQLVNLMVISFIIGLMGELIPTGKNVFTGILLRLLAVLLGMAAHYVISSLLATLLPDFIVTYAPTILFVVLAILLCATVFKLIVGTLLGIAVHPLIGAIYTFFVSNFVGSQISKAVLPTALITLMISVSNHFGIFRIPIEPSFIPAVLVLIPLLALGSHLTAKHL
jgi:hypothetical protein